MYDSWIRAKIAMSQVGTRIKNHITICYRFGVGCLTIKLYIKGQATCNPFALKFLGTYLHMSETSTPKIRTIARLVNFYLNFKWTNSCQVRDVCRGNSDLARIPYAHSLRTSYSFFLPSAGTKGEILYILMSYLKLC